ncbi:MAG: alpha/beta fold hydrolase [Bacteroidales bacterium]|nr:alpha/beta fold hydrolase [Bacteroidales bacterium]
MELFVRKRGDANKHLIILHGLYGSGDNWLSIANKFSDEYTVHLPDLRNHGKSPHHNVHTYQAMSDDIFDYVEKLNIKSFSLAGHSMGGKVAMFFAKKHPAMLEKLIILDISPRTYHQLNEASNHSLFHLNMMSFLLNSGVEKAQTLSEAENILMSGLNNLRLSQFMLKNLERTEFGMKWRINLNDLIKSLPEISEGLNPDDFIDRKILVPSLFLRGSKSDYLPEEDNKLVKFIFPNSKIITINNAGHWLHAEQPKEVFKEMKAFLE